MKARYAVLVLAVLLYTASNSPAQTSGVLLNEVLYFEDPNSSEPLRNHEWGELHNKGASPVNLTGWVISNRGGRTGPGARALPAVVLPPGSYLVVHFAAGVNDLDLSDGCGQYYTGDAQKINLFDNGMDEIALYSITGIVDFVAWHFGSSGYAPGTAHNDAVAAGIWTTGTFVDSAHIVHRRGEKPRQVQPGTSIGRDKDSTDTNRPPDWDAHGGRDAFDITPCRRNLDLLPLVPPPPPPPPPLATKVWTVMIYMDGDNSLESYTLQNLKQIEKAGGSDASVNIVVMVDGQNMLTQAALDAQNKLILDPATTGGTWRFQLGPEVDARYVNMLNRAGDNPYLGELDLGHPNTVKGFIAWAKLNYPAQKYGLLFWDHGLGWKAVCVDDSSMGARPSPNSDSLYMGELSTALAGEDFELIGFDACLMAMIEVGYQIQPFGKYMVASEDEISAEGWPYDRWVRGLKAHPAWNGARLGRRIVRDYHDYYQERIRVPDSQNPGNMVRRRRDPSHTLSLTDQSQLPGLEVVVSSFGDDLIRGSDDFRLHDNPKDNVEHLIALDAAAAERFGKGLVNGNFIGDHNFMDLHHFGELIRRDPGIPACYKTKIPRLLTLSERGGAIVLAEEHGPSHPNANGLSIYMPIERTTDNLPPVGDDPYDYPYSSRVTDGNSDRAMYAPNNDALPKNGRDVETGVPLATPQEWPLVPAPNFRFVADTHWDEFLMRFYHPVADNHIDHAVSPDGQLIFPIVVYPACGNPIDEITVPCGSVVFFSGKGSSDEDIPNQIPTHWMWDFDNARKGCTACIAPYEVGDGEDGAKADDDMDADHDANKAPLNDEKEADAPETNHTYPKPGDYVVTVNVWDDNHTLQFHDTKPTAEYVHPQTDSHISIVHVRCNVGIPPECHPRPGFTPQPQCFFTVQGVSAGLAAISLLESANVRVNIPQFETGSKAPVDVTSVVIETAKPASLKLSVTDVAGNVTVCTSAWVTLQVSDAGEVSLTLPPIRRDNNRVTILNGEPGLQQLLIKVNSKKFRASDLGSNKERTVDISSATREGENVVTLVGNGGPGARALVVISN